MPEKVMITQTPYEESKTIDLGSFAGASTVTCDLADAQRFMFTMTGDVTLALAWKNLTSAQYLPPDQEITLLIKTTAVRTLTLPAANYDDSGLIASLTVMPSAVVGTGGHVISGVTTSTGVYWDLASSSSALPVRFQIHDVAAGALAKGQIIYLDGGLTTGVWDARAYSPVGATMFPVGVVEAAIAAGDIGFALRVGTLSGIPAIAVGPAYAVAGGLYAAAPLVGADTLNPGIIGRCTATGATSTIKFDFSAFPSHIHGTSGLQDSAVTDVKIASKILKHPGAPAINTLFINAVAGGEVVAGASVFAIGAESWTFVNVAPGAEVGFQVNIQAASVTAVQGAGFIVARMNNVLAASAYEAVDASGATDGIVIVEERVVSGTAPACTSTFAAAGANSGWSGGAMQCSRVATVTQRVTGEYTVGASDVTAWTGDATARIAIGSIASTVAPRAHRIDVRTAAGVHRSINTLATVLVQVHANFYVLEVGDTGAVIEAADIITYDIEL